MKQLGGRSGTSDDWPFQLQEHRMCRQLKRIIVIAIFAGVMLTATLWRVASARSPLGFGQRGGDYSAFAYTTGERVPAFQGMEFLAGHTLIAFIGSNCQFCTDSAPLYRAVADERDRGRGTFQFIIAGREPVGRLQAFASRYHVRADRLVSVVTDHVKIRMTPTLVLFDRSGVVQGVWTGEQPAARGEAILQRLRANGS